MAKRSLSPEQQKKLLASLAAALGVAAWFTLLFLPQKRAWSETGLQLLQLRRQMADFSKGKMQLPQMEEEVARLKVEYEPPGPVRPPEEHLPELLKTLTDMAHQNSVRFIGAKPTSEVNRLTAGESGYLELQVMCVVGGGYHSIGAFIDTIESSSELLRVKELFVMHDPEQLNLSQHLAIVLLQAYLVPTRPQETS